jgi:PAS domain S-box-containing protein
MATTRILVVEDELIVAADIEGRLTRLGYEVVGLADRGEDAVRLAGELRPDLVLMDIRLRGDTDGVEAADQIRSRFHLPVVYLTAHADDATLHRAKVTEPFGYVLKPFEERELRTVLEMALYKHAAERRLAASERRYATTLASIGDAVIATDAAGRATFLNPVAESLTGWPAAEAAGRPLAEVFRIVNEHTREPVESPVEKVLRDGVVVGLANHTVLLARDGREAPIDDCAAPIHDDSHSCAGVVLVFRDVAEKRKAEEELRLRDRAIAAAGHGVLITDARLPDIPIIFANEAFERMTGYSPAEAAGRNFRFLQGPDTDQEAVAELQAAIAAGRPCAVELLNYRKDGTPFWNAVTIAPVRDASGRLTHFVGIQQDVSERRRLEEDLRQAQKMEAVGRLAGGIAHDFNNLLTIILGYTNLLQDSIGADHPWRGFVAEIAKASERAADLTRHLLAFGRKQMLQPKVIDLNQVVGGAEKFLRRLITETIELVTELHPSPLLVRIDPGQVEQVILNLAINARDAMPQGGRLTITTALHPPGPGRAGLQAALTVSDTGHGMDAATKAQIWEPFFTTKGQGKGTGLGLASVYGIIKQSGGDITVASEPGRGAAFTALLPLVAEDRAAAEPPPGGADLPRGTETLLLVEDDEVVRGLTARVLRLAGYTVLEARHGVEAMEVAARLTGLIHLLVTDVVMPHMSGRALADVLTSQRPGLRVLFLTGYSNETLLRGEEGGGVTAVLTKPFTPKALATKVREVLDHAETP